MMRLFLTFGYLDFQKISESNDDFLDLLSEFSCGCKDQSLTLLYGIVDLLKNKPIALTRIARGLPAGAALESADDLTLQQALSGRTKL